MNYWHILDLARDALQDGRYRDAEQGLDAAVAAREADNRRVFVSETVPDGLRSLWRKIGGSVPGPQPGRWERSIAAFTASFQDRAHALIAQAAQQLDLGPQADPETAAELLGAALFLTVDSRLCERRLPLSSLLLALFDLLPLIGRLPDRGLVRADLDLDAATRLQLVQAARDHLGRLPADQRAGWARTLLELLDGPAVAWTDSQTIDRSWLAAGLADMHADQVGEILDRWEAVDAEGWPERQRQWSRLRRVEILGGCDRHRPAIPDPEAARRLAATLPDTGEDEVARRVRNARAVLDHRWPSIEPARGWISAAIGDDGLVRAVAWWGQEPRDVATWPPGDTSSARAGFLAAAQGRIVWHGDVPSDPSDEASPTAPGRSVRPFLEAILEPMLPSGGWNDDLARRLALARSGAWREGWRSDLGHPLLVPPGQDGRLGASQIELEPALFAGLLWLAVLGRVNEADPALRAGLGELGRRGDKAAGFLHAGAVLGAPDRAAVDAAFEAWTLPLLWTRPDPLTTAHGTDAEDADHEDLAGQDVAVVATGRPGRALAAWGPGQRRWRVVLDRIERLSQFRRQARESYGPVTVVPPSGRVNHLGAALRLLEELARQEPGPADDLLAVAHWIRLVESHNGDLLDFRIWRPRPVGACPLYDRYAQRIAALDRQAVPAADTPTDGGWGDQYAQRVRRSGLVAGLVDELPETAESLDAVWGVFDGSEASWVFLDSAAVHWRLATSGTDRIRRLHAMLAPRGRRHLSLLSGRGLFPEALAAWLDGVLASYGRPYHLDLTDATPPRLRLAGRGPLPDACLDPAAAWLAPFAHLRTAGPTTQVLAPATGSAAGFWTAAAGGVFGDVAWTLGSSSIPASCDTLVVPRLHALDRMQPDDRDLPDHPEAWRDADRRRRDRRRDLVQLAALECGAYLAAPVGAVEILDGRWWRWLAPPDLAPAEAVAWAGVPTAELIDLAAAAQAAPPAGFEDRLVEAGRVPGLLAGWPGPPLAAGRPVSPTGTRVHTAPAALLWRDLVADLLRTWEQGGEVRPMLVVAETPPPGMATVTATLAAAGATVPTATVGDPTAVRGEPAAALLEDPAPLTWVRPGDLLELLRDEATTPAVDRALVLDLDGMLPLRGHDPNLGARLLGWLAGGAITRLDLVGGLLGRPWSEYLSERIGAEVPPPPPGCDGWSALRRAAGPRLARRCPQCGCEAPGVVDGSVCSGCGLDLPAAGVSGASETALRARSLHLLRQTDLGREEELEIWDGAAGLAALLREAQAMDAQPAGTRSGAWRLPDGRRWRLRRLPAAERAGGDGLLLRLGADVGSSLPPAPASGQHELTLLYDRCDLGTSGVGGARSGAERFLALIRDPGWLTDVPDSGGSRFRPLVPEWRLSWLAGVDLGDVRQYLDLVRWAAVMAGDLSPAAPGRDATPDTVTLRTMVPVRDMELGLADLAARLERTLDAMLAGGLAGAWHEVMAPDDGLGPSRTDQGVPDLAAASGAVAGSSRLDRLLALFSVWPGASAARLSYRAVEGAWFSSRRRVMWLGDRAELAGGFRSELDGLATWLRSEFSGTAGSDRGSEVSIDGAAEPLRRWRLLLGQELGFWRLGGTPTRGFRSCAELLRMLELELVGNDQALAGLLLGLAAQRDEWTRRLVETAPGGVIAVPGSTLETTERGVSARSWWRRPGQDPHLAARGEVARLIAATKPARLVIAGPFGTGRGGLVLEELAASAAGRDAEIWCPDHTTAVRLHLAARDVDPRWQPRLRIWEPGLPLPRRDREPSGARQLILVAEMQRFPRQTAYQLQESAREGQLLLTIDTSEVAGAWEDLFLTTPRRDEVLRLQVQVLQAQQPWRVTRPLLGAVSTEQRGARRERGQAVSRRAGTLDECAAAVAAAAAAGGLGELVTLTAPLHEDVQLLVRALTDRGWAAVERSELDGWLLPGSLELAAALADAHRRGRELAVSAAEADRTRDATVLGAFLDPAAAVDWAGWLRSLPAAVLGDADAFITRLRRSPWGTVCCLQPASRQRLAAMSALAGVEPGDLLTPSLWQAWRRQVGAVVDRKDLAAGPPAIVLAAAVAAGGPPAESMVYVCFGPEPAAVHLRVLSRATDRLLVLYQEHSPLPGERESDLSS